MTEAPGSSRGFMGSGVLDAAPGPRLACVFPGGLGAALHLDAAGLSGLTCITLCLFLTLIRDPTPPPQFPCLQSRVCVALHVLGQH